MKCTSTYIEFSEVLTVEAYFEILKFAGQRGGDPIYLRGDPSGPSKDSLRKLSDCGT